MTSEFQTKNEIHLTDMHQPAKGTDKTLSGLYEKIYIVCANVTVEPVLVLFLLPSVMCITAITNLDLEKACRVNLHLNESICDGLTQRNSSLYNDTDEVAVQKMVASMSAWKNVIKSLVPPLLLLFLGSWSDRTERRKPCILIPVIGEIITCVGVLLCIYFFYELPMEINGILESAPTALAGGWFTMFMGLYSYISVVSSNEMRTLRIGAVHIIGHTSFTIGIALSGILIKTIGLYGVFSLALAMNITSLLYVIFVVKEVSLNMPNVKENNQKKVKFLKKFFAIKHIKNTFKVVFKPRQNNWRKRICFIMVLVMVIMGPMYGELNVIYLFTRYKFGWNEIEFSLYYTYNLLLHVLGTIFSLTIFSKILRMDDAMLGIISCISKVLSCFVYAFAPNPLSFYLGVILEIFSGTSLVALRSLISKLVPPDELGKISSLFGISEALMPLVYGPMYSLVYKATIHVLPGTFFLVGGALTVPAILIFLWLYIQQKQDTREDMSNKGNQENLLKKERSGNF